MTDTILITGVGKRLGYALTDFYLQKGAHVIGTYRTEYPIIERLKQRGACLYQVDFYQQAQVDRFVQSIQQDYQALSAIIHNASDWLPDNYKNSQGKIDSASIMNKMMAIHVSVPYQLNLAFRHLLDAHQNHTTNIIHISDYVAEKGSSKHIAYAASKTAMNNLTMSFAALLAPKVKVNSISPALVKFNEGDDENYQQKAFSKALLPREAGFDEIVAGVDFVLRSEFMTGRNLQLDGGRHLK